MHNAEAMWVRKYDLHTTIYIFTTGYIYIVRINTGTYKCTTWNSIHT